MSDEYGVDLDEVMKVIDTAEVLIVRFHLIQDRLLVDFRRRPNIGPFIGIVPPAESLEERFRSIRRLRPQFPVPERVMSFHWPRTMPVLLDSGVWQHLADRIADLGGTSMLEECGKIMEQLVDQERREVNNAIVGGEHYQTLWQRQRA